MPNFEIAGKSILITGASQGIGAALARRLDEMGARIALLARDAPALEAVRATLERRDDALVLAADVADVVAMERAFAAITQRWGHLDAVVANAAVLARGAFESLAPADLRRLVDTNVFGALLAVRLALPLMTKSRSAGRVVLVGSYAGRRGTPGAAAYSATKGALVAFADALRAELGESPISVSLVSPGPTRTEIHSRALGGPVETSATKSAAESAESIIVALASGAPWLEATRGWRLKAIVGAFAPRWYDAWIRKRLR